MARDKMTKTFRGTKKGQIAVEFIFLMLIIFTLIATVVAPASAVAVDSVKEVGGTAQCKLNARMLANAIDSVNIAGDGAKQTLYLQLPPNCSLDTAAGSEEVNFEFTQAGNTNQGTVGLKTSTNAITCNNPDSAAPATIEAEITATTVTCTTTP